MQNTDQYQSLDDMMKLMLPNVRYELVQMITVNSVGAAELALQFVTVEGEMLRRMTSGPQDKAAF